MAPSKIATKAKPSRPPARHGSAPSATSALPKDAPALETGDAALPLAAVALRLIDAAESGGLIYIAADERQAGELGHSLAVLAPAIETLVFPPWDCLPFDRASPSREAMGRRVAVVQRLTQAKGSRIVVTSVEAAMQKIPPRDRIADIFFISNGEALDLAAFQEFVGRTGYRPNDRVDEPGDVEVHGQVVEVFPPDAATPVRVHVEEGRVVEISHFDPVTQRSTDTIDRVRLAPASEVVFAAGTADIERSGGMEHALSDFYEAALETLFDVMPDALVLTAPQTEARRSAFLAQLEEAQMSRSTLRAARGEVLGHHANAVEKLYLTDEAWGTILARHEVRQIAGDGLTPVPDFSIDAKPVHAFRVYLDRTLAEGTSVVLAGVPRDLRAFGRFLDRHGGATPRAVADWAAARSQKRGSFLSLELDLDEGIADGEDGIVLIAAADVIGTRAHHQSEGGARVQDLLSAPALKIGDTVIHEEHGVGVLRGLDEVEIDGTSREAVRLEYHDETSVFVAVDELQKLWRYGSDDGAVSLDRLNTEAWAKRRVAVETAVIEVANQLVSLATARADIAAPKLQAPKAAYEKFAARFAFSLTPDQTRAIEAVRADLASGHPMDRLVCGDVGFGKTEVALRAAAIAALAGKQVAVVAPTTVLARQHLHTFQKRFAGLGFDVVGLSRLTEPAEAKRIREGLADGSIAIVIGTHAVAGKAVAFADLGLMIIDEEQKFGTKLKAELRDRAANGHVLTMTATPIPRTLQAAMVGLQAVSVIATPPVQRRPVRTFISTFDPASIRIILKREQARGGQSFVVVPRIEDIAPLQARLAEIVPELSVLVAHGDLPAEDADRAMVAFAEAEGDVLLATNIIESGLDVPRANTMLIWHPERFGLAQLHQLRGRVGRGRVQAVAYLLSDEREEFGAEARARLATLETFDRLGAGLAISARDLDLRGAGDLVGDEQAGHMKLIGLGLYQSLLSRAVRLAKGEAVHDDAPPELRLEITGRIPETYIAEPELRIDLYARLSRVEDVRAIEAFEEEAEDRFGPLPDPMKALIALARIKCLCRALGITALSAGPRAIAISFKPDRAEGIEAWVKHQPDIVLQGAKLIAEMPTAADSSRFDAIESLLERFAQRPE